MYIYVYVPIISHIGTNYYFIRNYFFLNQNLQNNFLVPLIYNIGEEH